MKISWRDLFTTIIAVVAAVVLIAKLRSYDWVLLGSWKGAVGVMGGLGGLVLLFDATDFSRINAWGALEVLLAVAGVGLLIAGLLVASEALFIILAADVLAFWLTSVTRHGFSHEESAPSHWVTQ